ncbi:unnamed protein product, partial [Ranitomeya imitator]
FLSLVGGSPLSVVPSWAQRNTVIERRLGDNSRNSQDAQMEESVSQKPDPTVLSPVEAWTSQPELCVSCKLSLTGPAMVIPASPNRC